MTPQEIQEKIQKLESLWRESVYEDAISLGSTLLIELEKNKDQLSLLIVHNILGNINSDLTQLSQALEHYEKAIHLGTLIEDKKRVASIIGNKGIVFRKMSDYVQSLKFHQHALQLCEEIEFSLGIATNYGNIGIVYSNLTDYQKALECFEKAVSLNNSIENTYGLAGNNTSIGIIYLQLKEYEQALFYFQESLRLYKEIKSTYGIAVCFNNIGLVYTHLKQYSKALEFENLALEINEKIQNKLGIAANYLHIGMCYYSLENFSVALEFFLKSLALDEEIENKVGVIVSYGNLADTYRKLEQYDRAEYFLSEMLKHSLEIEDKLSLMKTYEKFAKLSEIKGDFENAYKYILLFNALKEEIDSLDAKEKARIFDQNRIIEEDEKARQLKLARFQEQERIFHNILPESVANRLIDGETSIADSYDNVSIFFADIVGFTTISSTTTAIDLVEALNSIFSEYDRIADLFGLEKIKTIGDAYMAVCGIPNLYSDHVFRAASFAIEISSVFERLQLNEKFKGLQIRIGLHCGPVVAGIIGHKKFAYDVWGDAVNIASRMESSAEPGKIQISEHFADYLKEYQEFTLISRGEINIKGKGIMNTYWLEKAR